MRPLKKQNRERGFPNNKSWCEAGRLLKTILKWMRCENYFHTAFFIYIGVCFISGLSTLLSIFKHKILIYSE